MSEGVVASLNMDTHAHPPPTAETTTSVRRMLTADLEKRLPGILMYMHTCRAHISEKTSTENSIIKCPCLYLEFNLARGDPKSCAWENMFS